MNKRIVQALLLSATIASINNSYCVASMWGQEDIFKTDVAAQEESTNLLGGISLTLFNYINDEIYNAIKVDWKSGWATTNVNVRSLPTTESDVYEVLNFNDEIEYIDFNDEWVKIKYKDDYAYVNKRYVSDTATDSKVHQVNDKSNFKSFEPYNIFGEAYKQFRLQQLAYTCDYGIRMLNGRYMVAIGTHFLEDVSNDVIGTYFDIILENGEKIPCILGDVKRNKDTDSNNMYTDNGCYTEFIVDMEVLDRKVMKDGSLSSAKEEWNSPIAQIIVYDKKIE